jgi:hypothetical protein
MEKDAGEGEGGEARRLLFLRPDPPQEGCYPKKAVMAAMDECVRYARFSLSLCQISFLARCNILTRSD